MSWIKKTENKQETTSAAEQRRQSMMEEIGKRQTTTIVPVSIYRSLPDYDPPDHIIDHIYLGCEESGSSLEELQKLGIKHVLVVGRGLCIPFPDQITYKHVIVDDLTSSDLKTHFTGSIDFLVQSRAEGQALVHCLAGISRSASIVVAYLMREHRKSLPEALDYVKSKRRVIRPNSGFLRQLSKFATELGLDGTIPKKYI